jgi:hypothetical protein
MTVNDAISKLRVMLGATTEEVKEVVETKMAEAVLVDGTEVYTEGELQAGAILFVRAGEGADADPFAPQGAHETTDGLLITVGESGEITNVEEKGSEETVSEAEESFEEEEVVVEEKKEFDIEGMLEGIATMLEPYTEEIKELKEELSVLTSRFNEVADEPAANKVRNTFSEEAKIRANTAEARLDRLVSLRKSKK